MMAINLINLVLFIALLSTQRRELSYINSHPKWAPLFHTFILSFIWAVIVGGFML